MITLYTFGPNFGLPDSSPFVTKAETLLRMSGLEYRADPKGLSGAPKGKLPYIADDGRLIADSTFIRWHLESKYGIDFDRGLSLEQRAVSWAFEKMAEDNLYWVALDIRWLDNANFARGPAHFFDPVPAPLRSLVKVLVRKSIRKRLQAHGMGRHDLAGKLALGAHSIDAISDFLGAKPFFMGAQPAGVDATIFAFVAGVLCPHFESELRRVAELRPNLSAYVGRMTARYFPEYDSIAGCPKAA